MKGDQEGSNPLERGLKRWKKEFKRERKSARQGINYSETEQSPVWMLE